MFDTLASQISPLAYLAVVVIGFFMVRTLRQIDKNQSELWKHMDEHETRLSRIEGEHEAYTKGKSHK